VGAGQSGEGGRRWWCGFNTSISAPEERRRDKALPEDEVEAPSSSWLYGKEVWHNVAVCQRGDDSWRRGGTKDGKGRRRC
jgi:hypothetical protein